MNNYVELEQEILQISQLNNVISLLNWDIAVNMPTGAAESREQEMLLLTSIVHSRLKASKLEELINKASAETADLDNWQVANLQRIKKDVFEATCISDDLQKKYVSSSTKCELIWREARKNNDYQELKPYLQEVLSCVKEMATAKSTYLKCSKYDALIDSYDPDRKSSEIKKVFSVLRESIPTLIQEIVEKQKTTKILPLTEKIAKEQQKLIGKRIMELMGFNFASGRLDESTHPFCSGTPFDTRLTNRYKEEDFISGLMGIIHETGHALYEQNLPNLYKNQPVGKAKGMAIHESQSLFWEMQVARSEAFSVFLSKLLRDEFGFKGAEYSNDNLYKLITRVKPDLIRVEADEVTYPMHVLLRFELEEELINGELTIDDLPSFWSNKMHEYLGIRPNTDKDGCMQDIHWPMGSFGYFPAYTNGAIIASMLMKSAKEKNSNIDNEIVKGDFANLNKFLDSNIRTIGSLKTTAELMKDATKEEQVNPEIFVEYIQRKY